MKGKIFKTIAISTLALGLSLIGITSLENTFNDSSVETVYADTTYSGNTVTITGTGELTRDIVNGVLNGHSEITDVIISGYSSIGYENSYGAFDGISSLTSVTIGDSVTEIGWYAFSNCTGLTSLTIGNHVETIGQNAFQGLSNLTTLVIPDSVTSIGETAFYGCGASSITIGSGITEISSYAFQYCNNLTSITIPSGVTKLGYYAFANCPNLNSVTFKSQNPPAIADTDNSRWATNAFDYVSDTGVFYVPAGTIGDASSGYTQALTDRGVTLDATHWTFAESITWSKLQTAISAGGNIKLTQDITAESTDTYLNVESGKTVTIDLNGHKIDRNLSNASAYGQVFVVNGNLTIKDTSEGQTGQVTGGNATVLAGGAVVYGTLNLESGSICNNKCVSSGAGVNVKENGTFIMTGGKIENNETTDSSSDGGALNVPRGATAKLFGGVITGNKSGSEGGIFISSSCANFTVGGTIQIYGNTTNDVERNIYTDQVGKVTISTETPLASGAKIGVYREATAADIAVNGLTTDNVQYFQSDLKGYKYECVNSNLHITSYIAQIGSTYYSSIADAVAADHAGESESNPTVITLLDNVTESVTIPNGRYITLDLNEKTLTAASNQNSIISVLPSGTLTVKNGTIVCDYSGDSEAYGIYNEQGKLTVNNVEINITCPSGYAYGIHDYYGETKLNSLQISASGIIGIGIYSMRCSNTSISGKMNISGSSAGWALLYSSPISIDSQLGEGSTIDAIWAPSGIETTGKFANGNGAASSSKYFKSTYDKYKVAVTSTNDALEIKERSITTTQNTSDTASVSVDTDGLTIIPTYQWKTSRECDLEDCASEITFPELGSYSYGSISGNTIAADFAGVGYVVLLDDSDNDAAAIQFKINNINSISDVTTSITLQDDNMSADTARSILAEQTHFFLYSNTKVAYSINEDDSNKYNCLIFNDSVWKETDPSTLDELKSYDSYIYVLGTTDDTNKVIDYLTNSPISADENDNYTIYFTSNEYYGLENGAFFALSSIGINDVKIIKQKDVLGQTSSDLTGADAGDYLCKVTFADGTYLTSDVITITVPSSYNVTFNANGHGTAPTSQTIVDGNKVTKPTDPTCEGYTFVGWYKEEACTNAWNFDTNTVTADTTLYAKWTKDLKDIADASIDAVPDQTYTGSQITPTVTVKYGETTLVKDTDYTVAYEKNIDVGKATITITGIGDYTGTKATQFNIVNASNTNDNNQNTTPEDTNTPENTDNNQQDNTNDGLTGGQIGAIVGGSIGGLALIYLVGYLALYRQGLLDDSALQVIYRFLPRGNKNK